MWWTRGGTTTTWPFLRLPTLSTTPPLCMTMRRWSLEFRVWDKSASSHVSTQPPLTLYNIHNYVLCLCIRIWNVRWRNEIAKRHAIFYSMLNCAFFHTYKNVSSVSYVSCYLWNRSLLWLRVKQWLVSTWSVSTQRIHPNSKPGLQNSNMGLYLYDKKRIICPFYRVWMDTLGASWLGGNQPLVYPHPMCV